MSWPRWCWCLCLSSSSKRDRRLLDLSGTDADRRCALFAPPFLPLCISLSFILAPPISCFLAWILSLAVGGISSWYSKSEVTAPLADNVSWLACPCLCCNGRGYYNKIGTNTFTLTVLLKLSSLPLPVLLLFGLLTEREVFTFRFNSFGWRIFLIAPVEADGPGPCEVEGAGTLLAEGMGPSTRGAWLWGGASSFWEMFRTSLWN